MWRFEGAKMSSKVRDKKLVMRQNNGNYTNPALVGYILTHYGIGSHLFCMLLYPLYDSRFLVKDIRNCHQKCLQTLLACLRLFAGLAFGRRNIFLLNLLITVCR